MRGKMLALVIMVGVTGMTINPTRGKAEDDSESRIKQGFAIAPVKLNLVEKNRAWVGLGSYLVNAVAGCNDCHTNPNYAVGGNPFLGQPKVVNVAGYLAGGRSFVTPTGTFISRNLTPDKTGLPEGGANFAQFLDTMRNGTDRHVLPAHRLLQVMPWPVFQDMTDNDLRAVFEYLRAIPCVEGEPGLPNPRPIATRCK